jgi:hypothetical protein
MTLFDYGVNDQGHIDIVCQKGFLSTTGQLMEPCPSNFTDALHLSEDDINKFFGSRGQRSRSYWPYRWKCFLINISTTHGPLPSNFAGALLWPVDNPYWFKGQSLIDLVCKDGFRPITQRLKLPWLIFYIKFKMLLVYTFQGVTLYDKLAHDSWNLCINYLVRFLITLS